MRVRALLSSGLAAILVVSASCTLFNGLTARVQDAGTDGTAAEDGGFDADTCAHARWPGPPDVPPDEGETFVVVGTGIAFSADGGDVPGFDLDGVCTCQVDAAAKCAPGPEAPPCDDDGGRDNVLSNIADRFRIYDFAARTNALVKGGETLIMKVEKYNGQPNDSNVLVTVHATLGAFHETDDGGMPIEAGPRFDETDRWILDTTAMDQSGQGWVTDKRLVVNMTSSLVVGRSVRLTFGRGVITGLIEKRDGKWVLTDMIAAGRWRRDLALKAIGRLKDGPQSPPFCRPQNFLDEQKYAFVKGVICGSADMVADDEQVGFECDALSGGARIETAPASLSGFEKRTPDASLDDDCTDTCPIGPDR